MRSTSCRCAPPTLRNSFPSRSVSYHACRGPRVVWMLAWAILPLIVDPFLESWIGVKTITTERLLGGVVSVYGNLVALWGVAKLQRDVGAVQSVVTDLTDGAITGSHLFRAIGQRRAPPGSGSTPAASRRAWPPTSPPPRCPRASATRSPAPATWPSAAASPGMLAVRSARSDVEVHRLRRALRRRGDVGHRRADLAAAGRQLRPPRPRPRDGPPGVDGARRRHRRRGQRARGPGAGEGRAAVRAARRAAAPAPPRRRAPARRRARGGHPRPPWSGSRGRGRLTRRVSRRRRRRRRRRGGRRRRSARPRSRPSGRRSA